MAKKYTNPVIMFKPTRPEWFQVSCIHFNLFANRVLPEFFLKLINPNKNIRKWQKKQR